MLLLSLIKNVLFILLILYIFGFLINLIFTNLKLDIKKIIYFISFFVLYSFLDSSVAYCAWEEEDEYERILNEALAEGNSVESESESNFNINSKKKYYILAMSISLAIGLAIYYYFSGGGDLPPLPSSNILNLNPFEESEVKYSEDSVTRQLDFNTTPQTTPEKALDRYASEVSPEYEKGIRALTDL